MKKKQGTHWPHRSPEKQFPSTKTFLQSFEHTIKMIKSVIVSTPEIKITEGEYEEMSMTETAFTLANQG